MADTPDLPGGADPTPPAELHWAPLTDGDTLVGALWAAVEQRPGAVNGGLVTHLDTVHPRLDWLGRGVTTALALGLGALDALAEVRAMGGVRWQLGRTTSSSTLEKVRGELMQLDRPATATITAAAVTADSPAAPPKPRKAATKATKATKAAKATQQPDA